MPRSERYELMLDEGSPDCTEQPVQDREYRVLGDTYCCGHTELITDVVAIGHNWVLRSSYPLSFDKAS